MSFRRRSEGIGRAKVACDACRHKKAKCDGLMPCTRCRDSRNDDICCYSRRVESSEQVFSALYVKMLRRQLHVTLVSLRFLVERIAFDKDCKIFVPDRDTPINTVINLIHNSPEFDHEQNQDFLEASDSELTMLSPPETHIVSPHMHMEKKETDFSDGNLSSSLPSEPSGPSPHMPVTIIADAPPSSQHKRKMTDGQQPPTHSDSIPKRVRGRPKKIHTASGAKASPKETHLTAVQNSSTSTDVAFPKPRRQSVQKPTRSSPAGSSPLTPASVRADTGASPITQPAIMIASAPMPSSLVSQNMNDREPSAPKIQTYNYQDPRTPLAPPYSTMDNMNLGDDAIEEPMGYNTQAERMFRFNEDHLRSWDFSARPSSYDAPSSYNGGAPSFDYYALDEGTTLWQAQGSVASSTMVSLDEYEFSMQR